MYPYISDVENPAPFYREAAGLLERDGWVQGVNRVRPEGAGLTRIARAGWCSGAAINQVAGRVLSDRSDDLFTPLVDWLFTNRTEEVRAGLGMSREAFERLVDQRLAGDYDSERAPISFLRAWNDRESVPAEGPYEAFPGRTKEEVVSALRECAAALEES